MSVTEAGEIARFLRVHQPFAGLPEETVIRVAAATEVESFPAGATIFAPGEDPLAHLRVIRDGAVEIVSEGRVLDLLGEGELFGHASMLSGLPPGFEARAAEATTCLRIDAAVAEELLAGPAGLRYLARSLAEPPTDLHMLAREPARNQADAPVGTLIRRDPVICRPETTIREAAEAMTAARVTSAAVDLGERGLGILTDRDLRSRVLAAGLSGDTPVAEVMSAPAYTCTADRSASEVLLEMLDRGLRHLPVLSARGEVLGIVSDTDLIAARTRSSFYLRERITAARSASELATVAAELRPMVVSLHDSGVGAFNAMAAYSVSVDAITRRLLTLELDRGPAPGADFAWLALGSQARREALPGSDVDSAIVWFGPGTEEQIRPRLLEITGAVVAGLARCGLRSDDHGACAAEAPFVRSLDSWQRVARSWIAQPGQPKALVLSSTMIDSRPVWGVHTGNPVADTFHAAQDQRGLLRLLARFALSHRPPTGFLRGLVVEHSGQHRGRLDIKQGGLLPIIDLARWAGIAAGVTSASTTERLRAAAAAETLSAGDAHSLEDAFRLISNLRVEHQVNQIRAGVEPDDHLAPSELSAVRRAQLRDAFRAVSAIQRRLASDLKHGVRRGAAAYE